ncbi:AAA family ATPase [Candidatus Dependentiae bacterium]|nr:AAA family ATPase [Candidatus Dependentiae bacterium]
MNIADCTRSLFLLSLISITIIPHIHTMDKALSPQSNISPEQIKQMQQAIASMSQEEIDEAMRTVVNICEGLLDPILKMLGELHQTVMQLAREVSVNTIRPRDKKKMTDTLISLGKTISDLKTASYTQIDPLQLLLLTKFTQGVIDHLSQSLKGGFKDIEAFDLEAYITNHPIPALTENPFEIIQKEIITTKIQLAELIKKSETAGLSWANKIFRKLDDYIIEPSLKYEVPQRFLKIGFTAFVGFYHFWLFLENEQHLRQRLYEQWKYQPHLYEKFLAKYPHLDQESPSWLINKLWKINLLRKFSPAPLYGQGAMINEEPMGLIGTLQDFIVRSVQNWAAIPSIAALGTIGYIWKSDYIRASNWISKKASTWRNRLKSGEYNKRADTINNIISDVGFDDIIGLDHVKSKMNDVLEYILHPERFDRTQTPPERGYLFIGEPGTGKTEFSKAIFGEIKRRLRALGRNENEVKFLPVPVTWITENSVLDLMVQAYANAPCIVFIDEIDFLKLQRWSGDNKRLSEFLQLMNGVLDLDPKRQIVFIGATNKAQFLDFALKRSGRFGVQLSFNLPSLKHRKEFIEKLLIKLALDPNTFDTKLLAQKTAGCTYEDIRQIIKGVIRKTQITGVPFSMEELEHSHDENVRNIIMFDDKVLSPQDQRLIAVHQTGHTMAHILLETNHMIAKVTTRPIQQKMKDEGRWEVYDKKPEHEKQRQVLYGQTFTYCPYDSLDLMNATELNKKGQVLMSGYAAERVLLDATHNYHIGYDGDVDDKNEAYQLALSIILGGVDIRELSKTQQNEMRNKAYELVKLWEKEVIALFQSNKALLELVSTTLQEKRSLTGDELNALIAQFNAAKKADVIANSEALTTTV